MSNQLRDRTDIPVQYTWDLDRVYPDIAGWETALKGASDQIESMAMYSGKISQDPSMLLDLLGLFELLQQQVSHLIIHAQLCYVTDTSNQQHGARTGQAIGLGSQLESTAAFVEPEILTIGKETLQQWMEAEPALAIYDHYFDQLYRRAPHVRSEEVEAVLGAMGDFAESAMQTAGILTDTDLTFEPAVGQEGEQFEVAQSNRSTLLQSEDREVRRTTYNNYADAHLAYRNTLANCLQASLKRDGFLARTRKYPSSLALVLAEDALPMEVFHNTLDVFKRHLPVWHRYWRVRRQALGYDPMYPYDIKATLSKEKPEVSYEQAVDWIAKGMEALDSDYAGRLRQACLNDRWIDVYPNRGKVAGAFSSGYSGTSPYIMVSFGDDLMGLSVLAHELGHSMHSYYTWESQPLVYSNYSLFVAEVASNFNQALVRDYLFRSQPDPNFQMALIEEAMSNFYRYFFVMPTLARFELETHQRVEDGKSLTADDMCGLMHDLLEEGYGGELKLDKERDGIMWATFGHLYRAYYTYQYTTGISGAHALAEGVLKGESGASENYLAFLRAGGSLYPMDALKLAGVDMTTPEPVEKTFGVLTSLVDRMEWLVQPDGAQG